jgi:hypothetical protein
VRAACDGPLESLDDLVEALGKLGGELDDGEMDEAVARGTKVAGEMLLRLAASPEVLAAEGARLLAARAGDRR